MLQPDAHEHAADRRQADDRGSRPVHVAEDPVGERPEGRSEADGRERCPGRALAREVRQQTRRGTMRPPPTPKSEAKNPPASPTAARNRALCLAAGTAVF